MPKLSIIIVAHNMVRQAMNTLYSLSTQHQRNVKDTDYEIVIVENESHNNLDHHAVTALGNNIRYIRRQEKSTSPAAAINEGFRQCRAEFIGLMIDGARMVTPRVIEYALQAKAVCADAIAAVPSYQLGDAAHHFHISNNHNEETEKKLLHDTQWQHNGYRLLDIASLGEANPRGAFQPWLESNCYFSSRRNFSDIGYAPESFDMRGGGGLNFHIYRALGLVPRTTYHFIMAGEGTFHQFHGGVSTSERADREEMFLPMRAQLESHWGNKPFESLEREPLLLGAITSHAQKYLHYAAECGLKRFNRLHHDGTPFWRDDTHARYTEQRS